MGSLDVALYALPTVSAVVGGASGCALIRGQVNCAINCGSLHTLLSLLGTTVLCPMAISISSVHTHLYVKHWTCYTYKHGHTFKQYSVTWSPSAGAYPPHRHSHSNMSDCGSALCKDGIGCFLSAYNSVLDQAPNCSPTCLQD